MRAILFIILQILNIYWWVVIASAVFSWLFAFNVVNPRNQFVGSVAKMLYQLTEPVFRQVRRVIPTFSGLDLSPIVVLLAISFLQFVITYYIWPYVP